MYGFSDMSCKVNQVENALEEATCIREAIEIIAKVKDAVLARFLIFLKATKLQRDTKNPVKMKQANVVVSTQEAETSSRLNDQQLANTPCSCDFNWIEFVH